MSAGVEPVTVQDFVSYPWPVRRTQAFRLQPIKMSSDLINQLSAVAVKMEALAGRLQELVKKGKNKTRHYRDIITEAFFGSFFLHARVTLPYSYIYISIVCTVYIEIIYHL